MKFLFSLVPSRFRPAATSHPLALNAPFLLCLIFCLSCHSCIACARIHGTEPFIIPRPRFFTCVIQWFLPYSNAANIIDKNHYTTIRSYLLRNSFIISKISWQLPSVTSTFSGRIGSCRDFRRRHQPFTSGRSKLIRTPS